MKMTLFKGSVRTENRLFLSFISLLLLFYLGSCSPAIPEMEEGYWNAYLEREDGNSIAFNLFVEGQGEDRKIYVANGDEKMEIDSIIQKGDSIFLQMPFFDSRFSAKIESAKSLSGTWAKDYGDRWEEMPFKAKKGDKSRFTAYEKADGDLTGSWDTYISKEVGGYKAIGLFQQEGHEVTGTFFTPSGDYRYLQGVMSGDTLKLSGFDGGHVMLFTALLQGDTLANGKLYSVNSPARDWKAERKEYETLPDSYAVNEIEPGTVKLDFSLKDMRTGEEVSLNDEKYKGKVIVLQMLGSWCPNCMDETPFMADYYKENKDRGVEIIALDFERTEDFDQSKEAIRSFFNHFDIPYPVLFSGVASSDPELTEKAFPGLPVKIHAFPTSIFIDKAGYVRKVHAGFNGPATGKYHDEFKEEFHAIMDGLIEE